MAKRSVILLYFVLNYLIYLTETNSLNPSNVLFSAELKSDQEIIYDGPDNYIKVFVAKDTIISGRRTIPVCFAVGCTKTALICEEKKGKMITTFRSVNDTRQAYFKSTLLTRDMVMTVNCRESHTACCFGGHKKPKPVVPVKPTAPVVKPQPAIQAPGITVNGALPTILLTPLRPQPLALNGPSLSSKPLKPQQIQAPTLSTYPLKPQSLALNGPSHPSTPLTPNTTEY